MADYLPSLQITSGFLEHVVGVGEVPKEHMRAQVKGTVCLLELGVDPLLFWLSRRRTSSDLTGRVWVASGGLDVPRQRWW